MLYALNRNHSWQHWAEELIILCFLVVITQICRAGEPADSLADHQKDYKRKARWAEMKGDIYEAIYYYEAYFEYGGDEKKIAQNLADLYFSTRDYERAASFYDSVLTPPARRYASACFRKGVVCMNLGEYEEAIASFELFRKLSRGRRDPEQLRRQARTLIESAGWALAHKDSVADVTITNLGRSVNRPHIEFSPFPLDGSILIYGSLVEDTIPPYRNKRQLYLAEKEGDAWLSEGRLEGPVNDPEYHTGNAALSVDGNRLYFTRCRNNWRDEQVCEIYMSERIGDKWAEPVKLPYPINDENYTNTQPALGQNYRTGADILYFVSDRPGSKGGLDIWYSLYDRKEGIFGEPRNAGSRINTRGNECCPFYDPQTGTLYFSSGGHQGFGGYDIYKSTGAARKWTESVPLPKPVNSSYDDMYFTVIRGTAEGFFTSNRPGSFTMQNGSCCDDIFYYRFNECTRIDLKGTVVNITSYDIYNELNARYGLNLAYPEDNVPVAAIPVQLFQLEDDTKEEILIAQTKTDEQGFYYFVLDPEKEYRIVVKNYGFFDKIRKVNTRGARCNEIFDAGTVKINVIPEIAVRFNVYYEHDRSRLTREAKITIDTLLLPVFDLFPNAVIEIGSHTDSTGTDAYNDKLSQRRSESVVKYLTEKGISPERLVAQGYGEKFPIAPNTNPDGSDNPEGRQLNRRTELKIVGEINTFYLDE